MHVLRRSDTCQYQHEHINTNRKVFIYQCIKHALSVQTQKQTLNYLLYLILPKLELRTK